MMKYIVLLLLCSFTAIAQPDPLKAFPAAKDGQQRVVIAVPAEENEYDRKIELIIGKTVPTDGVNRHFFGGKVEEVELKGWGYSYFELKELGPMAGTRMGVLGNAKPVDTFVRVSHELPLLRYNSRMPIVVYVPNGVEVRYRIWKAGDEINTAKAQKQ
jgi:ecotin